MSEFCKACSEEMFGPGSNDFKNMTTKSDWQSGRAAMVLCEGCGPIQVDPEGNCVSKDCIEAGKVGHNMPWYEQLPEYLEQRDAEARQRYLDEKPQSIFSFGPAFHTWWFVGTGKPVPVPCQRGCTACNLFWSNHDQGISRRVPLAQ